MSSNREYREPISYWLINESERTALKKEADVLRAEVDAPGTPWVDRERAGARLKELERRLETDRLGRAVTRRSGQQATQVRMVAECRAGEEIIATNGHVLIRPCSCGKHRWVEHEAVAVNAGQEFADPVPPTVTRR